MALLARLRNLIKRSMVAVLFVAAFGMMLIGKADNIFFEHARAVVADLLVPVFGLVMIPAETLSEITHNIKDLANLRLENARLRDESRMLQELQVYSARLSAENDQLAKLLNYVPAPEAIYISSRVLADASNSFAQSVIIMAGSDNQVGKGQVVINGDGLVGRVAFVGDKTARVMLLTDISSKVPVTLEPGGISAILSGDNSPYPQLITFLGKADVGIGDRIVTSGTAGVYPAGIPVGVVAAVRGDRIEVKTYADMDKLNIVRVVDYGLTGILPEQKCTP